LRVFCEGGGRKERREEEGEKSGGRREGRRKEKRDERREERLTFHKLYPTPSYWHDFCPVVGKAEIDIEDCCIL